jgi:Cysteine-rich domain
LQPLNLSALRSCGYEVTVPEGRTCCGVLHLHYELRNDVQVPGRWNLETFDGTVREAVIVNAVGCGAVLKGYHKMSLLLRQAKIGHVVAHSARIMAATNPECQLYLQAGIRQARFNVEILHRAELLVRACSTRPGG